MTSATTPPPLAPPTSPPHDTDSGSGHHPPSASRQRRQRRQRLKRRHSSGATMPAPADGATGRAAVSGVRRPRSASVASTSTSDRSSRGTSPHRDGTPVTGGATGSSGDATPSKAQDPTSTAPAQKRRRHETTRHTDTVVAPPPAAPPQPSHETNALLQRLSEVELQFQLEQDRPPRLTLAPRDVANLLLWSVPAPIPIIESPRIFFIKNKSRLRNAVVVYVNGWSYDEMLCTGIGLPRAAGASSTGDSDGTGAPASSEAAAVAEAEWNAQLCGAMLGPVREGRCWARPGRGSGCAGGVQYSPLFIPSTRNELEKDLWWRNDAPRRPGQPASSAAARPGRARDGDGDVVDAHRTSPAVEDARGVGSMFQQAMRVHGSSSSVKAGGATDASGSAPAPAAPTEATEAVSDAFKEHQHLWQDRALLRQYALHLPEHAVELQQLGFTVTAPTPREAVAEGVGAPVRENGPALAARDDDATSAEEAWTSFAAPSSLHAAAAPVKVFAFDCEMVLVEGGVSALARATLVDVRTGAVVLDLLVKPRRPVADYLTRFSGITAAMLEPVTTTLADCQRALQRHIDADTFVVGHSLENDFRACRCLPTCYVLDTTSLFPHPGGLPYKHALRFLAQRFLKRRIQQGAHDSAVDALVSAELAQLKLIHGPAFGVRPRVSVLGLIAEAAGDSVDAAEGGDGAAKSAANAEATAETASAAVLDVRVHLFDDAATLGGLLPPAAAAAAPPQSPDTAPTTRATRHADGGRGATTGRIDAVPVRHDEDAMRKTVRALQRRAAQLQTQTQTQTQTQQQQHGTDGASESPSFSLFWVQLTQAKVDVVRPSARRLPPPRELDTPATASAEPVAEGQTNGAGGVTAADADAEAAAHTAAQFRTVHDTNRRVLRIIEACPEETLVVVLTGRCAGEASGNHLSRAQGTCFAFVKDSNATGPRAEELTRLEETVAGTAAAQHAVLGGPTSSAAAAAAASAPTSLKDNTPPACQQQ